MKTSDFDYDLPRNFIAQNPVSPRDHSKLLIFDTRNGDVLHQKFFEIGDFLYPGDNLVLNRSRVIPARINFDGKEVFLLKNWGYDQYQVLVKPGRFFKIGREFLVNEKLSGKIVEVCNDGSRLVKFFADDVELALHQAGKTPLPPYITDSDARADQYQTVYAQESGSVAAPTAGLHFTDDLLGKLKSKGISIEKLLLHVGRGTFLSVASEKIEDHVMHEELYELDADMAKRLSQAKARGQRIIAVGTTSVRVLESSFDIQSHKFVPNKSATDIFIYPGKHRWQSVDVMITNFHLPKSTLIMLVASFLENKGVESPVKKVLELYELAKSKDYRFYSFGDAMMII